jgi:hypothetical protein
MSTIYFKRAFFVTNSKGFLTNLLIDRIFKVNNSSIFTPDAAHGPAA